jgi:cytochrome c556
MRVFLSLVSVAAILVTAACNQAEQAPSPPSAPAGQAATNGSAPGPAAAAPQLSAAEAPEARHESFEQFGRATKAINNELKGSSPSLETIQRHARYLHEQARLLPGWFPPGSGPDAAPRTRAKQEIWSNPEGFARAERAFLAAAQQFDAAAQSGNIEAVRGALPNLQSSCKGCHDGYRGPERD